jgi:hypothetical protein
MPQQIDLHTNVPSTRARRFSALFTVQALAALTFVGAAFGL